MKLYISADIEGIAGITHWDEASKEKPKEERIKGHTPKKDKRTYTQKRIKGHTPYSTIA
jgi:D-aminopeptidase